MPGAMHPGTALSDGSGPLGARTAARTTGHRSHLTSVERCSLRCREIVDQVPLASRLATRWHVSLTILLGVAALLAGPVSLSARASSLVSGVGSPRFVPGACPKTPFPIPALTKARCGFLVVPENRHRPGGRTIQLAVAIVPAASSQPAADPVVHMSGGPGVPAILEIPDLITAGLNRYRALIVMDQRGQLYSKPELTCPGIDQFNAHAVSLPYYAASTGRLHVEATARCYRRLAAQGIDLGAYNTTENAADIAALRQARGIKQWNVYGSSYGTDLALTYMRE